MNTAERPVPESVIEREMPKAARFAFRESGEALVVDDLFSMLLTNESRALFTFAARKPYPILRQSQITDPQFQYRETEGPFNFFKSELRENPLTNVFVGRDYKISFDKKVAELGIIIRIESLKTIGVKRRTNVEDLTSLLAE